MAPRTPEQVKAHMEKRNKALKAENTRLENEVANIRASQKKMAEALELNQRISDKYFKMWFRAEERAKKLEQEINQQSKATVITGKALH